MSDDPFTEYFTPERLKRFEELRERFPHWCLDWPSVATVRAVVTPSHRVSLAVQEMRGDLTLWEVPPARLGDNVQCEVWMEGKTVNVRVFKLYYGDEGIEEVDVEFPVAHLALFASIAHTLHSHQSSSEREHLLREWSRHLHGIFVSEPGYSKKRRKLSRLASVARHTSTLAGQNCPKEETEKRQARAKTAAKRLRSYWHRIGQDIGLIPTRRGGKTDLIPDDWIFELAEQAQGLLAEVRVYEPDTRERDAVRALLLAEPYPAGSSGNRSIAKQHLKDGRTREDAYTSWNSEVNLDGWCLRLAFPMLTHEELLTGLSTTTSWRWLPADRLGLDEDALSKRLSQHRHPS